MNNLQNEVSYLTIHELLNKYGEDKEAFCLHLDFNIKSEKYTIMEYYEEVKFRYYSEEFIIFCLEQFVKYDLNFINNNINHLIKYCIIYDFDDIYLFLINSIEHIGKEELRSICYLLAQYIDKSEVRFIPMILQHKSIRLQLNKEFLSDITLNEKQKKAFEGILKFHNF